MTAFPEEMIRSARDDDAEGLITLIGGVFAEYPGCVLDVDGELPELRAVATWFARRGGRLWVAQRDGRIVGSAGYTPHEEGEGVELRKLYVAKEARRRGLGGRLCALVEDAARRRTQGRMEISVPDGSEMTSDALTGLVDLWSDTRFTDAHRLYERRGYVRGPATRELHDKSDSVEYYFRLSR